jgi:uncharacterized delta-60 repeat protein
MWSLFSRNSSRSKPAQRLSVSYKPSLDALEDRCLLSAGALDPTFGTGAGYVTTALSGNKSEAYDNVFSVLLQNDGKIIAVGKTDANLSTIAVGLARYNPNGSVDKSFGNAGVVIGPVAVNTLYIHAALYPNSGSANDGKIVVGGLAGGFSIGRYSSNGALDTAFGSSGKATANFASTSNYGVAFEVIQPDGKIVALGQTKDYTQTQLARFNADGSLDANFGQSGMVTGPVPDPFALLLQADGKLLVVGAVYGSYGGGLELARYNVDGTLDGSFGSGGVVISSAIGTGLAGAIYPASSTNYGKFVVMGAATGNGSSLEIARFNADGSVDTNFGNAGEVTAPAAQITANIAATEGIAIQSDGRIVVSGHGSSGTGSAFATARYNADGSPDSTFGSGGIVKTSISTTASNSSAVALQADGKIVVAGDASNGTKYNFALARYLGDSTGFTVTGFPAKIAAGTTGTFTATIKDSLGNNLTGYTGTVHFSSSDPKAVLPSDYMFNAGDQGSHVFSATLKTAGIQSISVTDAANPTYLGSQGNIQVNPAAAHFVLSGPSNITKGTAFDLTLTVEDAYGNVIIGYTGSVNFTSSDQNAVLPSNYAFTAADNGVHVFTRVKLKTKGLQTISVVDMLNTNLVSNLAIAVS